MMLSKKNMWIPVGNPIDVDGTTISVNFDYGEIHGIKDMTALRLILSLQRMKIK